MEHLPLFDELAIVAALAVAVTVVLARLKLPTVAGLLAAGALLGPFGMKLVTSVQAIETLANVGVVLLLFTIGLEFSLNRLRDIFRKVALGGMLQVALTIGVAATWVVVSGHSLKQGLFYGFVFSLSSTAIMLRALGERRELDAPHGRFIVGTLIFQDLCVIPMVLIVPLLGDSTEPEAALSGILRALLNAGLVVLGAVIAARYVVPRLLGWVAAIRSREIFLLAILGICIGTAWLTSRVGLSVSLGAFVGGMVVADTEYSHRAMGDILPLRDAFLSVFFVSLGMLFDVRWVLAEPLLVCGLLFGFLAVKGVLATVAALAMRFPARAAYLAGMGLAGFGEFGFVLTQLGRENGVVTEATTGPLLAAGIVSMFLTPLLVRVAPHITAGQRLLAPLERLLGARSLDETDSKQEVLTNHVVIVGFGLAGRVAAESLAEANSPFVVLEMGVDNVRQGKQLGLPVYYGDATSEETLSRVHLAEARLLVLLINDPLAAERVVTTTRRVAPNVPILMRTHYLLEREGLFALGADDVVAEEVEGTIEVIARMLRTMETPRNVIERRLQQIRAKTQTTERKQTLPRAALFEVRGLDELKIESILVEEDSPAVGQSPISLRLRSTTGALVVGVRRDQRLLEKPDPKIPFLAGDIVYCVGTGAAIRRVLALFILSQTDSDAPPAPSGL